MSQKNEAIATELAQWETYWETYHLPTWEEIPNFGLYMEQVIILMKQYLEFLPAGAKDDQIITASAVNNYVRTKVMPEPQKKKYYRIHIAYLIMICSLKQSLSIAMLQKLIPSNKSESEVREIYCAYAKQHSNSARFFLTEVHHLTSSILNDQPGNEVPVETIRDLITNIALISGFSRLLAERLLPSDDKPTLGESHHA